jgi:anti-sigma factor RsiW
MKDVTRCRRAEELFSDDLDGTLDDGLQSELRSHLAGCADCRALRAALAEVVEALHGASVPEPGTALAERAAAAALRRARRAPPMPAIPFWLQAAAAVVAVATTAGSLLLATSGVEPGVAASRLKARTVSAGVYLQERTDRFLEDVRLLRVVITTAFEGRLERVNDRVDDYRRLMERRRNAEQEQKKSRVDGGAVERRLAGLGRDRGHQATNTNSRTPPADVS